MKRQFLLLLFVLLIDPAVIHPQDTLPPVVVQSSRLKDIAEPITNVSEKIIVITADDIKASGAKTIQEAFQYQTGMVIYDQIGNDFQSVVDMRGFNGQPVTTTVVIVDGVRINEPDFNTINFDLIPIEDIERIEILPGTATVFGRNALGGVVNITTKRGRTEKPHFSVSAGGGSYSRQKYGFTADGLLPFGNLDYYFGVTRELTDGFRDASGGRITRLAGKLGYRPGENTDITLSYTHVLDHLKQAGSLPLNLLHADRQANFTPGDFTAANLNLIALNARQKLPMGFSLAVNGFYRNNDQEGFVRGVTTESLLQTLTASGGGVAQLTHEGEILTKKNLATLGFEYSNNRFDITNCGFFSSSQALSSCASSAFDFLTKQLTKENVIGAYLSDSITLFESLILNAGFRYDWDNMNFTDKLDSTLNGDKTYHRFNPKAGLVYTPVKDLSFSFTYSQGIRIPTVSELFAQGPFGSNPNLLPMTSRNFEIGAKGRWADWLEATLALFYMPVKNEILFVVTDPVNFFGMNENISRTLRRGIEFSLKGHYQQWVDWFVNYTVTKATFETNVLLFSGQVTKGDELPLVPRHRVSPGINVHPLEGLTLSLFGTYVSRQFLLGDEPNHGKQLADYFVLNSRIAYEQKYWTAQLTFNNMTDRKYSTSGIITNQPFFVPAPGFNVFGGLTLRY